MIGVSASEVLSPTPPVLCLSTFTPLIPERSSTSPLSLMASVKSTVSRGVIPRKQIAIVMADI